MLSSKFLRFINYAAIFTCLLNLPSLVAASPHKNYFKNYERPKSVPYPAENAYSKARETLGKTLFFDPRLSGSNWISCATCHNPALSWGDGLPKGIGNGMQQVGRRSPTVLNLAWGELMFWDGRVGSLEEQALAPLAASAEMNLPVEQLLLKLKGLPGYKVLFDAAYPGEGITANVVAKAIATFERTLVSGDAPFDRWIKGDESAISSAAKQGFVLFNEKALCSNCHSGWRFSDEGFYDIGVDDEDVGRGQVLPDIEVMQHAFKTPGLRNIAIRAPYLHNGSEKTLQDVVAFYNQGGKARRPSMSEHIKPLGLTSAEQAELVEFLKSLTGQDPATTVPVLPR